MNMAQAGLSEKLRIKENAISNNMKEVNTPDLKLLLELRNFNLKNIDVPITLRKQYCTRAVHILKTNIHSNSLAI